MRPKLIRIRNVLGIDELEIEPGRVTIVTGDNATGKTSFYRALLDLFAGGAHEAELLRNGAEDREAVIVFDDEMGGEVSIEKTATAEKSKFRVRHSEAGTISAGKTWLDKRLNRHAFNPAAFLVAKPKERVDLLLRALPAKADAAALAAICGDWIRGVADLDGPALPVIDAVRSMIYEKRKDRNVSARDQAATAKELRAGLPAKVDSDTSLPDQLRAFTDEIGGWKRKRSQVTEQVREREQAREKAAQEAYEQALAKIQQERADALKASATEAKETLAKSEAEVTPKLEILSKQLGEIQAESDAANRAVGAREQVAKMEKQAAAAKAQAEKLTAALEQLDAMKAGLLSDLGIEGLEIVDGNLRVHGIPFNDRSTAERVQLAFALCRPQEGQIPLCIADGMEALSNPTLKTFKAAAEARGIWLVLSKVDAEGGPLRVEIDPED